MENLRFSSNQKIKGIKAINGLFEQPNRALDYPLKAFYFLTKRDDSKIKIAVSVSKRRFKKSPDRNRIKRIIREAYRINQQDFFRDETLSGELLVMIVYIGKELPNMNDVQKSMINLFIKIKKRI